MLPSIFLLRLFGCPDVFSFPCSKIWSAASDKGVHDVCKEGEPVVSVNIGVVHICLL